MMVESRSTQARQWGWVQSRLPEMSAKWLLPLLKDADSDAELKGLAVDSLVIEYIQVSKAPKVRRGLYRASDQMD